MYSILRSSPYKFIIANLISGVISTFCSPACRNHMPAHCWHMTPLPISLSLTCVLQHPLQLGALEIVWWSIACAFCRLHTDPFLTLPLGWFPFPNPQPYSIVSCLFSLNHWHPTGSPVQKIWEKEIFLCVMTACLQKFHLGACPFPVGKYTLYYLVKCHNIFNKLP